MKHPPYHLRVNKAVDRVMMVDVLRKFGFEQGNGTYYTLAGPFLEDLKIIDHFFPNLNLVSLERNEDTLKRQKFHRFCRRLILLKKTMSQFLYDDYDGEEENDKVVFWLDYTDLRLPNFTEFQTALKKVPLGSIVRITLPAESYTDISIDELSKTMADAGIEVAPIVASITSKAQKDFETAFLKILPSPVPPAIGSPEEMAVTVQKMVQKAVVDAMDIRKSTRSFTHIHSMRYNDNTNMLSVTGVVHERQEDEKARIDLLVRSIKFGDPNWGTPIEINVPALSSKERHLLEEHLPLGATDDENTLYMRLGYKISGSEADSKRQLLHYAQYHREYPQFIRLPI